MHPDSWLGCLRRRGLGELCLKTECPPPCDPCAEMSCEEELKHYRKVYRTLLTTKRAVSIGDGDSQVTYDYAPATIAMIKTEIDDLNFRCGPRADCHKQPTFRPGPIRIGAPQEYC